MMTNKLLLTMALLTGMATVHAQTTITGKEWDDPLKTSVNRETAHTIAIPMASEADITQNDMTLSPYFQSLNGTWKFMWVGKPTSAQDEWCAKEYNDASWTDIDVPSSWQVCGVNHGKSWDKPRYVNWVWYPF